ncbi:DUF6089 family protein [Dyadobacter subterraneus]|uniref:DUF6089 domain-containing protein n=1 Tax=Dyadobacter subterraneus TaxID=2773304 RepID=A0ABR9WND1_9BACT|nr:DUF6089 family protein [Dyadobacter subterraneus]MBE9465664.1 hypothetical protein [Dyadobacter subterraneus]
MRPISKRLSFLLVLGLLVVTYNTEAQVRRGTFIPYSTVGFGVGTSNYYGDMASYTTPLRSTFGMMRWSVTGNYTRHFTPRLAARASFTYARIAGDDYKMNKKDPTNIRYARNLSFRNDLKEFAVEGIFKLTPDNRSYDRRPQFSAYLFGGVAVVAHNPKALDTFDGNWVKLQSLGTEGQGRPGYDKPYSLIQFAIPLGIGVRYKINDRFDMGAELGFRKTFTDYLDDVAGNYADPAVFADNPLALTMANKSTERYTVKKGVDRTEGLKQFVQTAYNIQTEDPFSVVQQNYGTAGYARGTSPNLKDNYLIGTVHINYIIPSQIKCPPLK